ncbi:hypothetical protein B0H13DRAFT_1927782 [Mycena leptocephala]|nr:hypothetical protein B0H13DRAFT_1927782 [Mycena leptocephala]
MAVGPHLLSMAWDTAFSRVACSTRGPNVGSGLLNETTWELAESRSDVEEFLSLPTAVDHLRLVVDGIHDPDEVEKVLSLTGNMPLVINLVAHLVDSEDCSNVLSRWEDEKTSLVSDGYDRRSNLDLSISLSLSSPRLNPFPHSRDLLSLLSILPDGLLDPELVQSKPPINNILGCKMALICTTLAYIDEHKRLKHIVQNGLKQGHPDLVDSIYCACNLNYFSLLIGQGPLSVMSQINNILPHPATIT